MTQKTETAEIKKNKRSFDYEKDNLICPSCCKRVKEEEIIFCNSGIQCPRCRGIYPIKDWLDNDDTDI